MGERQVLLCGAAAFGGASVLAAYATGPGMLIAARAVLGVAGATLAPSTLSLIGVMFRDARQRSLAIGLWFSCFMGGAALGPILGGMLLEHFWWGSAFLLGVPAMALLLVAGRVLLPEYRDPSAGRIDLGSVALPGRHPADRVRHHRRPACGRLGKRGAAGGHGRPDRGHAPARPGDRRRPRPPIPNPRPSSRTGPRTSRWRTEPSPARRRTRLHP
jgi:MFS family permease